MMRYKCCQICYEELQQVDPELAEFWINMCGQCLETAGIVDFKLENKLLSELAELEDFGFVTTHETDTSLMVRMEGIMIDQQFYPQFCNDYENHIDIQEMF